MPANYELNIDHQILEVAAWDIVTLGDLEEYLDEAATLPNDLSKTIQYMDFEEATETILCSTGALQLCRSWEKLMDRGLRGSVVHAPDDASYEIARMLMGTFAAVCGSLPEGYRLTRTPVEIKNVRPFLHGVREQTPAGDRKVPLKTPRSLRVPDQRRLSPRDPQPVSPPTYLPS
jgi:hypothetical protein